MIPRCTLSRLVLLLALLTPARWLPAQAAADSRVTLAGLKATAVKMAVAEVADSLVQVRLIGEYKGLSRDSVGAATGVLIEPSWVITSTFGLGDRQAGVLVKLRDGSTRSAKPAGVDHSRQVALLQLSEPAPGLARGLEPRSHVEPGETAIAVGAAYGAAEPVVSVGIVSATGRLYGRAVQTDAATSPANYGGLLIDLRGRVLGLITPIGQNDQQSVEWYDSGIGFAAPLDAILNRLPRMKQGEDLRPGKLGVAFPGGNGFTTPPIVEKTAPAGPAAVAGVLSGDRITGVNDTAVRTVQQLRVALGPIDAGEKARLTLERGENHEQHTVEVQLAAATEIKGPTEETPELLQRLERNAPQAE
ncbi:MAG: serine protease [Planctomycetales bacterium]|nr:serine protease [Planctomycetales bacterium]